MRYYIPCILFATLSMFGINEIRANDINHPSNTTFFDNVPHVFANVTSNATFPFYCRKPMINYVPWRLRYRLGKQCLRSGNYLLSSSKNSLQEKMTSLSHSADRHKQTVSDAAKALQQSIGIVDKPHNERVRILSKFVHTSTSSSAHNPLQNVYLGILGSMVCAIVFISTT